MRGFALLLALATMAVAMAQVAPDVTDRPIIGVFTHPRPTAANPKRRYLAASYVKWIEAAGGRVVPLPYEMNDTAARAIIRKVNGLLFPGGSADLNPTARNLMKLALQINDNGDVFPVWGTCLGFEWLSQYYGGDSILNPTDSENLALALELADPLTLRQSLLYGSAPESILSALGDETLNVTMNNHQWSVSVNDFDKNAFLSGNFTILSTNTDRRGKAFVSTMEHNLFPVFGTQWHPEKNAFEFGTNADGTPFEVIPHSRQAIEVAQYHAAVLVNAARKNRHTFPTPEEEAAAVLLNKQTSGELAPAFMETYFFD